MAKIYQSATQLIGNTPLLEVTNLEKAKGLEAKLLVKLEYFNPSGSVKDRAAYYMVKDAEEKGILKEGSVIIEPTSGNTGIGLASIAAAKGYRAILTMPETMSVERSWKQIEKAIQGLERMISYEHKFEQYSTLIQKAMEIIRKEYPSLVNIPTNYDLEKLEVFLQSSMNRLKLFCTEAVLNAIV